DTGDEITFATRSVGGFPFSYEVVMTDLKISLDQGRMVYDLPRTVSRAALSDPDALVTALPDAWTMTFTPGETLRQSNPMLSEKMLFEMETDAAEITLAGLPGFNRTVSVAANSILAVHSQPEAEVNFAIELAGLSSDTTFPGDSEAGQIQSAGQVGFIDYAFSGINEEDRRVTIEVQIEDLQFTGDSDPTAILASVEDLAGLSASGNFLTGKTLTRFAVDGKSEQPGGAVVMESGTSSSSLSLAESSIEMRSETRGNRWELKPDDDALPYRGAVVIDIFDMIYRAPVAPTEEMQPFDFKFAMAGLNPDEAVWALFDAEEKLDRSPAELTLDFEGTMRLTKSHAEMRPGEAPPVAFGNLVVNRVDLKALGASAEAAGSFEFLQPINAPMGKLTLRMSQVIEVLTKLVEAEVLTPDILLMGSLISQTYLVQDSETGDLTADIEMGPQGVTVNGKPIGGPAGVQ
ncbi:MAG: DUF2125 domain-containing protein, partial [Pseudomonadota bacterium]